MNSYELRLHDDAITPKKFLKSGALAYCDRYAYVRETGEQNGRLHSHWYLESSQDMQALRSYIKRKCPNVVGNGGYALKKCDHQPLKVFSYMLKEGIPKYINFPEGFAEDIESKRKEFLEEHEAKKRAGKEKWKLLRATAPKGGNYYDYCRHVINFYKENDLMIRLSLMRSYADSLMFYCGSRGEHYVFSEMTKFVRDVDARERDSDFLYLNRSKDTNDL